VTRRHPARARSPLTASRVRKARRGGSCPLCGAPVVIGQNVGLVAAGWAHLPCVVQRRQLTQVVPANKGGAAQKAGTTQ
jgi:hypothetical protein